jgi:nitroimidazol reductase NimA-like FMN-containing flavoprotein (pyridoxamine 5'-phosphate oxidase superfamily)
MSDKEPVSARPLATDDARPPTPWAEAQSRLERAQFYWLATARPDGLPHVMPVLAVWLDGALHFVSGPTSRKGKNLARDRHCVITADADDLHLIVEGEAAKVRDEARLRRVADEYASKYGWKVTVRDGAFYADGAPTAGPPPYEVYEVVPTTVFSLCTDESFGATRWRF